MRDVFFILCCIQSPYRSNFKKQHHMPHSDSFFCIVCYSCMPHSNMYEIYCTIATLSSFIVCVFFFLFRHLQLFIFIYRAVHRIDSSEGHHSSWKMLIPFSSMFEKHILRCTVFTAFVCFYSKQNIVRQSTLMAERRFSACQISFVDHIAHSIAQHTQSLQKPLPGPCYDPAPVQYSP